MRKELKCVLLGMLVTFMLVALAFVPMAGTATRKVAPTQGQQIPGPRGISISCTGSDCKRVNPNADELFASLDGGSVGPAPMSEASRAANTNKWAVLAGVSDYPGTSMDLQYCHWDIYQTRGMLLKLGWPDSHIHLLLNSSATYQNILNEIAWMKGQENSTSQTYFHYSGHGNSHTFYVYDTTMSDGTLASAFNGYESSQKIIVMDTCFAGSFTALQLQGSISLMACANNEYSYDGMFTPNFVNAMKDSSVSVESAFATAKATTSQQTSGQQNPVMWDNVPGDVFLGDMPPTMGAVPDFSAAEDTPIVMTLTPYEHDAEDSGIDLKWSVSQYDPSVITTVQGEKSNNDTITLTPELNYHGTTPLELTLQDSGQLKVKKVISVTWTPVNDGPVASNVDRSKANVLRTQPVVLKAYGSDIDNLASELKAEFEVCPTGSDQWTAVTGAQFKSGHWEAAWTPVKDEAMGPYDIRGRLKDPGGLYSDWYVRPNGFTVRNNLPVVTGLSVPDTVERTRNVTVSVVGSDVEDAQELLSVSLEVKAPGGDFKQVGTTVWVGDHWDITFTPAVDAMLGQYDVRARLKDNDGDLGDYLYKNGSLEVKNCRPSVTDIIPDQHTVIRGEELQLVVNGYDAEDINNDLVLTMQSAGPDDKWVDMELVQFGSGSWTVRFSPDLNATLGNYTFRARLTDTTEAQGDWFQMNGTVEVLNAPPIITGVQMDNTTVFRTRTMVVSVDGSDAESSRVILALEAELSPHGKIAWSTDGIGSIEYVAARGDFEITIAPDAHFVTGSYDLRVRLVDPDNGTSPWFVPARPIDIMNGPPVIDLVAPGTVSQDQPAVFDASGSKDPEGGSLSFSWDFGDGGVADSAKPTHIYKTFGSYTVMLKVKDIDGLEVSKELPLKVNGLPSGNVKPLQGTGISNYDVKFHTDEVKDPEGSTLTYKWDFNTDDGNGVDSTDPNPSFNYGKPGTYEYKVTITDANGGTVVKTGTVTVTAMSQFTLSLLVLLIVVIVVVAVLALVLMRRKKRRPVPSVAPRVVPSAGPSKSLLDVDDL